MWGVPTRAMDAFIAMLAMGALAILTGIVFLLLWVLP